MTCEMHLRHRAGVPVDNNSASPNWWSFLRRRASARPHISTRQCRSHDVDRSVRVTMKAIVFSWPAKFLAMPCHRLAYVSWTWRFARARRVGQILNNIPSCRARLLHTLMVSVLRTSAIRCSNMHCLQSALFNFQSLLLVILLLVCTCTYIRGVAPRLMEKRDGCVVALRLLQYATSLFAVYWAPSGSWRALVRHFVRRSRNSPA